MYPEKGLCPSNNLEIVSGRGESKVEVIRGELCESTRVTVCLSSSSSHLKWYLVLSRITSNPLTAE